MHQKQWLIADTRGSGYWNNKSPTKKLTDLSFEMTPGKLYYTISSAPDGNHGYVASFLFLLRKVETLSGNLKSS